MKVSFVVCCHLFHYVTGDNRLNLTCLKHLTDGYFNFTYNQGSYQVIYYNKKNFG